jgi:hypothetical protein
LTAKGRQKGEVADGEMARGRDKMRFSLGDDLVFLFLFLFI